MIFAEEFLHYIWKQRKFEQANLVDCLGQAISITNTGTSNPNAGPDFNNAKIQIGETLWAGNVEIHIKSSDWQKHNHHKDESYDSVILHVVWENDVDVYRSNGTLIPALTLKSLISESLIDQYQYLKTNQNWIPCEKQISHIDSFTVQQWLQRVLVERLELKAEVVTTLNQQLKGNWEETFYITLSQSFGFKVNPQPFAMLAQSLPQQILSKHKNNPLQIEALIFGQAGFLNDDFSDSYPNHLKKEFLFLKEKYKLRPLDKSVWKFSKLRPNNFPTLRLAQFAALVNVSSHLFSKVLEAKDIPSLKMLFNNIPVNDYWENHFQFDVLSTASDKTMGDKSLDILLINAIAVAIFCYGRQTANELQVNAAFNLIEQIKAEKNAIVTAFSTLGIPANSAFDSQALIHLKNYYCDQKKCLSCSIGNKILKA
jgi:hypothetical protein